MQSDGISQEDSGSDDFVNARDDATLQRAVLDLLLEQRPHQLNETELAREVLGENPNFEQRDAFERAVEDLIRAALLQRWEAMILLTRAARHFASLEEAR